MQEYESKQLDKEVLDDIKSRFVNALEAPLPQVCVQDVCRPWKDESESDVEEVTAEMFSSESSDDLLYFGVEGEREENSSGDYNIASESQIEGKII